MKQFQLLGKEPPKVAGHFWLKQSGHLFLEEVQVCDGEPCVIFEGTWVPIKLTKGVDRLWGQAPIPRPESKREP